MNITTQAGDQGSRRAIPSQFPKRTPARSAAAIRSQHHQGAPAGDDAFPVRRALRAWPLMELAGEVEASGRLLEALGEQLLGYYKAEATPATMERAAGVANLIAEARQRLKLRFFDVLLHTTEGGRK